MGLDDTGMSFRLFVYYCAVCGAWAAFAGWAAGRALSPAGEMGQAGIRGLFLGMMVALGLSFVDGLWNLSPRRLPHILIRVVVALVLGAVGGLLGGLLGNFLFQQHRLQLMFLVAWTVTGMLVGASIAMFEAVSGLIRRHDLKAAQKKLLKCLLGGGVGGLLGGLLALMLRAVWVTALGAKSEDWLWSPTALGFVALGMSIGLGVGLAQVMLKQAWLKVEAGFRPGREMILSKERSTIGRAEVCDLGLFGDHQVERLHALIVRVDDRYFLDDAGTPGGTFVNDQRVGGRTPLSAGDTIRMGNSVLRFHERLKRSGM